MRFILCIKRRKLILETSILLGILIFISVLLYYEELNREREELFRTIYEKYGKTLKFKKVPESLSKLNGTHPRLYLTQQKISELRRLIKDPYKNIWLNEKKWVDEKWLKEKPSDVYYYDPREMLWLRTVGDRIPHYAFCYLMTRNETYLQKAREWVFATLSYKDWGPYPDLAKAHLLCGVSLAYDWLYHNFTSQERSTIRDRLTLEARLMFLASIKTEEYKTMWWHRAYLQNHLWVNLCGLGTAGFALYGEVPDAEIWINQANNVFKRILSFLADDGASHEGVEYWSYGTLFLLKYIDLAKQLLGEEDLFDSSWLRNTAYYRLYNMLPRNMWGNKPGGENSLDFADSVRHDTHGPVCTLRKLAAEYKNEYAQWLAQEIQDSDTGMFDHRWLNLIWYDPTVPATPPTNLSTMRHFDNLDLVIMRSDWSGNETLLAFKCGPYIGHKALEEFDYDPGGGHVHPDANHFDLLAFGKWLIIDDGYVDKRTSQHNTVLINGYGQLGEGSKWFNSKEIIAEKRTSAIIRAESNSVYDYVIGDAYNIYRDNVGLNKFLRHIIFLKPDTFIIVDELETVIPSTFDWLLHYEGSLQKTGQSTFTLTNGDVNLNIEVILPHRFKYEIYEQTAIRSGKGQKNMPTLKLSPEQKVNKTVFLVVLHPAGNGQPHPKILRIQEEGKMGLIIQYKGEERKILFDFTRTKRNDRVFKLIGVEEPQNNYYFTRELPH